jgi:hypothetical protein
MQRKEAQELLSQQDSQFTTSVLTDKSKSKKEEKEKDPIHITEDPEPLAANQVVNEEELLFDAEAEEEEFNDKFESDDHISEEDDGEKSLESSEEEFASLKGNGD